MQSELFETEKTEAQIVKEAMSEPLDVKISKAIGLLQLMEPIALKEQPERGYWLAYSGGKDSGVILHLAQQAGVKFHPAYCVSTIDPPELVRFIKREHPEVEFVRQPMSMMHRVATTTKGPPTQLMRWCCEVYKENGGNGYTKIIGVRAAESVRRAKRWRMVTAKREGGTIICPIVYWTDKDVWDYHRRYNLPYCELYDQGLKRLGCIGCPMAGVKGTKRDFELWPLYARNWERAVKAHWQKYHDIPRRDGNPRAQAGFSSAEEYWQWWVSRSRRRKETGCELGFIFT